MENRINIVIGSWGAYNACNERALGSKWLCLNDYWVWDQIRDELIEEGFKLDGEDGELFIQDIEGLPVNSANWDMVNPKALFELLKESEVLTDDYKFKVMSNYLEVMDWLDWRRLVERYGTHWDADIILYEGRDWYDLGYELLHECYQIPEYLDDYIDYARYGEELSYDGFYVCSDGIIEIR